MKLFLYLFFIISLFLITASPAKAVYCQSAGAKGYCEFAASCNSSTRIWVPSYVPAKACQGIGDGCCLSKTCDTIGDFCCYSPSGPDYCNNGLICDSSGVVSKCIAATCDAIGNDCCIPSSHGPPYCNGNGLICDPNALANPKCIADTTPTNCTTKVQCTTSTDCINDAATNGVIDCFDGCNQGPGGWFCSQPSQSSGNSAFCNGDVNQGVSTAIGCLMAGDPQGPQKFIGQLLGWGVGVGGGIAFLLIVYAGFMIATAAGDPKRVQAGRELLTSAISGLILIVLSVLLLNFIGVKVLNLSGLGFNL